MYSEIAANKRETALLLGAFFVLIGVLAVIFGRAYGNYSITIGAMIGSAIYALISYFGASRMALAMNGAKEIQKRDNDAKILAGNLIPVEKAEETWTADIHFSLEVQDVTRDTLEKLKAVLANHPGSCRGYLHLVDPKKTDTVIALPDDLRLAAGPTLNRSVHDLLGFDAIKTTIMPIVAAENGRRKRYIRRVK